MPSGDLPYPLFAYAGLLPWTFFATAIATAGNSVVGSERLITKIYFPTAGDPVRGGRGGRRRFRHRLRLADRHDGLLPGCSGFGGSWLMPVIFGAILLAALGVGTLLAALNVAYRDFRYVIPFLVQLWMFATPSVYMQVSDEPAAAGLAASARPVAVQPPASPSSRRPRDLGADSSGRSGSQPDDRTCQRLPCLSARRGDSLGKLAAPPHDASGLRGRLLLLPQG